MGKNKFISIKTRFLYFSVYLTAGLIFSFLTTQIMMQYFVSCSNRILNNYEEFSEYWNELDELDQILFEYAQTPTSAGKKESKELLISIQRRTEILDSRIPDPFMRDLKIITEKYAESCENFLEKEQENVEKLVTEYQITEQYKNIMKSLYSNFYEALDSYLNEQMRFLESLRSHVNVVVILSEFGIVLYFLWHVKRLAKKITVPVQDLTDQAKEIIAGNSDIEMRYVQTVTDEIGILNNVFYQMVETNNRNFEQIKKQSDLEKNLAQTKLEYVNLQAKLDRIRLRLLQSRVNPHFMFNTLNIIAGLAVEEDAERTTKITVKTAKYLRYSLVSLDKTVKLKQEFDNIRDYIDIQKERFGERIRAQLELPGECEEALIPSMILQPLCENSLMHGMANLMRTTTVSITARTQGEKIVLCVEDDGLGMSQEVLEEVKERLRTAEDYDDTQGIGIVNTYQRLQMFFEKKVECAVESQPGVWTAVTFEMPFWKVSEKKDESIDCR
ncbi:MAG: histidine kinase [Robinsoniella sp.]|nr:histidine kinase [Robinsoniella sp.]